MGSYEWEKQSASALGLRDAHFCQSRTRSGPTRSANFSHHVYFRVTRCDMVDPLKVFWVLTNSTYLGKWLKKKEKNILLFVKKKVL